MRPFLKGTYTKPNCKGHRAYIVLRKTWLLFHWALYVLNHLQYPHPVVVKNGGEIGTGQS